MEETCGIHHEDKYRKLAPETENLALNWRVNQGYILREVMSDPRRVEYKSQQGLEWILHPRQWKQHVQMSCGRDIMIIGETEEYLFGWPWEGRERGWGSHRGLLGHSKDTDLNNWQGFCFVLFCFVLFLRSLWLLGGRPHVHKENQLDCSQGKRGLLSDIPRRSGRALRAESMRQQRQVPQTRDKEIWSLLLKMLQRTCRIKNRLKVMNQSSRELQGLPQGHGIRKPGQLAIEVNRREEEKVRHIYTELGMCVWGGVCVCVFHSCNANAMKMRLTNKLYLETAIWELRTRSPFVRRPRTQEMDPKKVPAIQGPNSMLPGLPDILDYCLHAWHHRLNDKQACPPGGWIMNRCPSSRLM